MPKCNLILDSCCDLPPDLVNREGIFLLKFPYTIDGGTFEDDLFQTVSAEDFYTAMRKGATPSTSQVPQSILLNVFEQAAKSGKPCVYLAFTSGLSGSYDASILAAEAIRAKYPDFELHIVNTLLASAAEGFLVFEALRQWERGLSAEELAEWAEDARYFVDCLFMVDDLEALKRGGRIPASVATAGAMLDVKPLLTIDTDGKLAMTGVARGRKKGIKQMVDYYEKNAANPNEGFVVVASADAHKDMARLCDSVKKQNEGVIFINCEIGPVIGAHVGPDMLAIIFWGKDKREHMSVADKIAQRVKGGARNA
jgi:DegV family protein with EDD domain